MRDFGVVGVVERSVRSFFAHRMTTYAAALAYRALFDAAIHRSRE